MVLIGQDHASGMWNKVTNIIRIIIICLLINESIRIYIYYSPDGSYVAAGSAGTFF